MMSAVRFFKPTKKQIQRAVLVGVILFLLCRISTFYEQQKDRFSPSLHKHNKKGTRNQGNYMHCQQAIKIVVVACGSGTADVATEAINMMKSALLFTQRLIEFHIFTSNLRSSLEKQISEWPQHIQRKFKVYIRDVDYPLAEKDKDEMRNWWGPCASFRLFLPDVLSSIDSILYVDTDVLFLGPVEELWDEFCEFDETQVGGLAQRVGWNFKVPKSNPNFIETESGRMTQVNSGVFLMNLTRMREPVFRTDPEISSSISSWNDKFLLPLYRRHISDMHGDQNLINTVFHYNPELLYFIPCHFNYHHKFCIDKHEARQCSSAEKKGAYVIHGNANTYQNNFAPAFRAVHQAMTEYHFEDNVRKNLFEKMRNKLRDPKVEGAKHCANKTDLFLKNIQRYV